MSKEAISFDHDSTRFSLEGRHEVIDCRQCHTSLEFFRAESNCTSCHLDVHEQSVGQDCGRCHNSFSWLVNNIAEIHRQVSFTLLGAHAVANCVDCHQSETALRFEPRATDCYSCHTDDYASTINPEHEKAGFSTNCIACHQYDAFEWTADEINHDFFPLTQGHDINECNRCHTGADYAKTSPECITCHEANYVATTNPNHQAAGITTTCADCHTTSPGWKPAEFRQHDLQYFPIYSGSHEGEWLNCSACHENTGNYSEFTCITCHKETETAEEHNNVFGYAYTSSACLACHPNGEADGAFNHDNTNFPLTGAHMTVECLNCHASGFAGTPTACFACHTEEFNQSINPGHPSLGLSTDCVVCHTTDPDWNPAKFDNHNDFYALNGAHAIIATQCAMCHQGNYTNTPNTCAGCHQQAYDETTDPSHTTLQFSTDCATCHSETTWVPATFDHDSYFPIYSGSHEGEWNQCSDCHTTPGDYSIFTCTTCHTNPETDEHHTGVSGYTYNSTACLACHPNGEGEGGFDHNTTNFPLTGAHTTINCLECHAAGFEGTPTECKACHTPDFNQTTNPNHQSLGFSLECATCHTTTPGWKPATLDNHNDYYVLTGAHLDIASQCASCHQGDYNNTPTTCAGCHQSDYDQTTEPPHATLQFSLDCAACHNERNWSPAVYDHDEQYFPIYSGTHAGLWDQCSDCHTSPDDYSLFTCTTCHTNPETDEQHTSISGYTYNSSACLACHPDGDAEGAFNHDDTDFPLTGAHTTVACLGCHASGYAGTPTACFACHSEDFNQSINPNHTTLGLSNDCVTCHTTAPDWNPASFDVHNQYYVLNGAHALIADQCVICHNGEYNNTPNTCAGCHQTDYNETTNPSHIALNFSLECATCHTEDAWSPAAYTDHDVQFFPIYSGTHQGEWNQCSDCHTNASNYAIYTCVACHTNPETDQQHAGIGGYNYENSACLACHPTGESQGAFDHNQSNFPLTGSHQTVDCIACHANGYAGTPTECEACHMPDYTQSSNPNHIALDLPTDCATCHTTAPDWNPATFTIHNQYYVLAGAHALIADQCVTCHNGDYNNTPNTCVGCHQTDYNQTDNPSHTALQFSNECATCHTESEWIPATFPNHNDYYPLNGAHALISDQCVTCHNGDYNNTPNTCAGCHQTDYNQTTNPPHIALNFPLECATCHTEDSWVPAEYTDHDVLFFPIYSGTHQGEWSQCSDCHTNASNYAIYTCVACHTNPETDQQHAGVGGYYYENSACLACHPTGESQGAFDHNQSNFPLTGAHQTVDCMECHSGGYQNTPTECEACHMPDYNASTNPSHISLALSTDCAGCHTTVPDWNPATFAVHNQYYALNGAHALISDQCVTCHNGDYNNTPNTCAGCHQTDYNQTTNPPHIALNFPLECAACHTEDA